MIRRLSASVAALAILGLALAVALYFAAPAARIYSPIALLIPIGMVFYSWRQSAGESRRRSVYDDYAFREIVRMKRKRVEGW
jgi:O-antigen/teichoic acid export membrane protein